MKKYTFSIFVFFISTTQPLLSLTKSVQVNTAGTLSTLLSQTELQSLDTLIVAGFIDGHDFGTIQSMSTLQTIDLSGVTVKGYGTPGGLGGFDDNAVPWYAFSECKALTSINLPVSVTTIGRNAFQNCKALKSIKLPPSLTVLMNAAFSGCISLASVDFPVSLAYIGNDVFIGSGLTSLQLPTSIKSIGSHAFYGCIGLKTLDLSSLTITSLDLGVFMWCTELTSVILPSSLRTLDGTFAYCKALTSINLPPNLTSLGFETFSECISLTTLNIPSTVQTIGEAVFLGCTGLKSCNIPNSVTKTGSRAFSGCSGLASIYAYSTNPIDLNSSDSVFKGVNMAGCILYVPSGSRSLYQAAYQWKDFVNIVEMTSTAVNELSGNKNSVLYPNPTSEDFSVIGLEGSAQLRIFDENGRQLVSRSIENNKKVSVSTLPTRVYTVKITTPDGTTTYKLLKR